MSNTATVSPPAGLTNTGYSASTDTTTWTPQSDLTITNVANNAAPDLGTQVGFTVTVTNNGPSTATGVGATDLLPSGLAFVSAGDGGVYDSSTHMVTWSLGTLASGATDTLLVEVDANGTGSSTTTATVSSSTVDTDPTTTATATVDVPSSVDLGVMITDVDGGTYNSATNDTTGGTATPGSEIIYTLTVTNRGSNDAEGVTVNDPLASNPDISSDSWTGGQTNPTGVGDLSDTLDLTPAESVTYIIVAEINPSATGTLSDTATVGPPAGLTNTGDSASTDTTTLDPQSDLTITNVANNAAPDLGTQVGFTVTVTNNGPSTATGVGATDLLPSGLAFVSAGDGGVYDSSTHMVTWSLGTLASGATDTLLVEVDANGTGSSTTTATVSSSTVDTDPTTTATATVDVPSSVDLGVMITDVDGGTYNSATNDTTGGTILEDLTIEYKVTVTNNGSNAANGASLSDVFGDSFISTMWFVSNDSGGASDTGHEGTGNIDDTLNLPAGSSISFIIDAEPDAGTGSLSDTVTLAPPAGLTNTGTSSSTDTVTITSG